MTLLEVVEEEEAEQQRRKTILEPLMRVLVGEEVVVAEQPLILETLDVQVLVDQMDFSS